MTKTTFTATAPDGSIHTRTSENRTYTHAILTRPSFKNAMRRAMEISAIDKSNYDYHAEVGAAGAAHPHHHTPETIESYRAANAGHNRETYAIEQAQLRAAAVLEKEKAGVYAAWTARTWCGRPDLAHKELARAKADAWNAEAVMVDAIVKAKGGAK